ncbi:MAG: putative O-glycosylation ligase, exosortase A system-associated [Planctomycetes bacterium]|jgi:probable O-glycosylation ligase (exosortase A-associated)|nr:putative O-glycosylation ligase, exosortase A system-associated [Planctomycetota bacterium]
MRDIALLLILLILVYVSLPWPFLGLLALTIVGYLYPQSYAAGFMQGFPAYELLLGTLILSILIAWWRGRLELAPPTRDWRLFVLAALWLYFVFTTTQSMEPGMAWPRLGEISKILPGLLLTLLLVDTREKLFYLLVAISLSIALLAVKGGYWAVMSGFSDRVYGPPDSHFHDNNHFAVLVVMNIPLLILWLRQTRHRPLRYVLMAGIALSVAAALSSWSRGALLTLSAMGLALLLDSRRKLLALSLLASTVVLAFGALPEKWFERMETIPAHQAEGSAQARLDAWRHGVRYAVEHPLTGAGFEGWRFVNLNAQNYIDWHSAYVEMMAEHGLVAFGLWLALLLGTILSLTRLAGAARTTPEQSWAADYASMLRAALIAYGVGAVFLGLAYWDILYHLLVVAVIISAVGQRDSVRSVSDLAAHGSPRWTK